MKKTPFITVAVLMVCLAHASSAYAQTASGSTTGSGSTASGSVRTSAEIIADIRALAPGRNPQKLKDVMVPELKLKAWEGESAAARERLWEHRAECREAIRRANRDQLMDRVRTCYRSDLLQDINILRKQSQYLGAIPLLNPTHRTAASGAILSLTDAQMTIVNAIDTGLFEQPEGMEEAKRNLRSTYREPYWLAMTHVRADRELTWIIFMLKDIEGRLGNSPRTDAIGMLLTDSLSCLENAAGTLEKASREVDRSVATAALIEGRNQLQACRKTLKKAAAKELQQEAEKLKEEESQK